MTKEKLIELIDEHLTAFTPYEPAGHIDGIEELVSAILKELSVEYTLEPKRKVLEEFEAYLSENGSADTWWMDQMIDEFLVKKTQSKEPPSSEG